jgi:hypothetical protein
MQGKVDSKVPSADAVMPLRMTAMVRFRNRIYAQSAVA